MAAIDLIFLSIQTHRIPIVPPFWPTHVGEEAGLVEFSAFFDLQRLSQRLNIPILEWRDVKNFTNPMVGLDVGDGNRLYNTGYYGGDNEDLGCWSVWMTQHALGAGAREGEVPPALNLDISWTPVRWDNQIDTHGAEEYNSFALAELSDPQIREVAVREAKDGYLARMNKTIEEAKEKGNDFNDDPPGKIPVPNHSEKQVDPDDHLLCFDYLYFTSTHKASHHYYSLSVWSKLTCLRRSALNSGGRIRQYGTPSGPTFISHRGSWSFLLVCYGMHFLSKKERTCLHSYRSTSVGATLRYGAVVWSEMIVWRR
jgi:hypothetical protein